MTVFTLLPKLSLFRIWAIACLSVRMGSVSSGLFGSVPDREMLRRPWVIGDEANS